MVGFLLEGTCGEETRLSPSVAPSTENQYQHVVKQRSKYFLTGNVSFSLFKDVEDDLLFASASRWLSPRDDRLIVFLPIRDGMCENIVDIGIIRGMV